MAEPGSDYTHGQMYTEDHVRTFQFFMKLTKWGSLFVASLVLFLVLWFCTPAGFFVGAIAAVILAALGIVFLSEKPGTSAH